MIVVPLIFLSIINGLGSVQDSKLLGRIGIKAAIAYIACTTFAICLGIIAAIIFQPGAGMSLHFDAHTVVAPTEFNIIKTLLEIVPENCLGAMAQGNVIQVVFFAIFCGLTLTRMKEQAEPIIKAVRLLTQFILSMMRLIVRLSPAAAFCLMAWCVGTQGIALLQSLSTLIIAGIFAFVVQYIVFGVLIAVWGKLSPLPFYKHSLEYQAMAFSTSSTKASLPTTMQVCREKMGISDMSTSFILPLGASINMDGLAIYLGLCTVCFAQAMHHTLSLTDYGIIMLTATLGSIGGAGIPSAAIVMLPMILAAINLPSEAAVALILGIDRLMDTFRSAISITGDAAITLIVDSSEGLLDRSVYYGQKQQLEQQSLPRVF